MRKIVWATCIPPVDHKQIAPPQVQPAPHQVFQADLLSVSAEVI
jgi:hypothetical protein